MTGRETFEEPPDELRARLQSLHAADRRFARSARWWQVGAALAGVLAFAGIVLETWPLAVPAVAAGAGCGAMWWRARARDLDDRKLRTVTRLQSILAADLPAGRAVRVTADFREYRRSGRVVEQHGARFEERWFLYADDWLRWEGTLADDCRLTLAVRERFRRKEKPKRRYTRVRERITATIELRMRLARRYGDAARHAERLRGIRPPAATTLIKVDGSGRRVRAVLRTLPWSQIRGRDGKVVPETGARPGSVLDLRKRSQRLVDGDVLLRCVRWAYRGLSPARR